jgi:hypothetical protein
LRMCVGFKLKQELWENVWNENYYSPLNLTHLLPLNILQV